MPRRFTSPQEIEEAEREAQKEKEELEEKEASTDEEEQPEEPKQEEPKQESEEEQPTEEEPEEPSEEKVSSELDEILEGRSEGEPTPEGEEEEEDQPEEQPTEPEAEESEYEPMDLEIDNDKFEEITSDPQKFQDFIQSVRDDAVAQVRAEYQEQLKQEIDQAKQEVLQNIPDIVDKTAQRAQNVKQIRQQFFEQNPALQNKLGYVRDMTNTVASQNPDWSAKQVLDEVAKRAQRDLDLSKQAEEREQQRKSENPKFAGAGGRRTPGGKSDNRSKQDKLLDDTFGG